MNRIFRYYSDSWRKKTHYSVVEKQQLSIYSSLRLAGDFTCERYVQFTKSWSRQVFNKLSGSAKPEAYREGTEHFRITMYCRGNWCWKVAEGKWNVYVNGGRVDKQDGCHENGRSGVVKLGGRWILLTSMECRWNEKRICLRLTEEISKSVSFQYRIRGPCGHTELNIIEVFQRPQFDASV